MARVRPVEYDDRLTLVEHLDELRSRIIASLIAFVVVAGVCFWQNDFLLDLASGPLPERCTAAGECHKYQLLTLGVGEAFTTTLTVSAYAAIVITLPILLYQIYSFILPALSTGERRVTTPFVLMVPFLFIAGLVFAYYVVVPAALNFLIGFNADNFDNQVRAREYYSFFALTEASVGMLFQVPVGILAVTRLGIVTPQKLAENRRYAILIIAVVAMLLPGTDPVTMLLSMAPLVVLFEGSLLLSRILFGKDGKGGDPPAADDSGDDPPPAPGAPPGDAPEEPEEPEDTTADPQAETGSEPAAPAVGPATVPEAQIPEDQPEEAPSDAAPTEVQPATEPAEVEGIDESDDADTPQPPPE